MVLEVARPPLYLSARECLSQLLSTAAALAKEVRFLSPDRETTIRQAHTSEHPTRRNSIYVSD